MGGLPFFVGASLAAAAAGVAFAFAWRLFFPPGAQSRFWALLSALTQELMTVDEVAPFLRIYRRLGLALAGYIGRNLAVTALGLAALAAAVLLALVPIARAWDARGGTLTISAPNQAHLAMRPDRGLSVVAGGQALPLNPEPGAVRMAICSTGKSCLGLSLLAYEIVDQDGRPGAVTSPVLVRWTHNDRNPFAPYLSDLEAVFVVVFMLAMTAGMLWPSKRAKEDDGLFLKQADFALIQFNEALKPLLRFVGGLETRLAAKTLPARVDRPVFITGLARSGTTTVLNALTRSREAASHQYRDFPFLAAPLAWSRLQGAIAKDIAPVERPHKDRILITKVSPEAYEEPLWQQFFPDIHDPARNQRLTEKTSNPKFERFFTDHLRKIVRLRGGERYVSKGNYNIARIEYLAKLFPDAVFVTPVRDPMTHVASLVRQHALFKRYAETDPRIPPYLKAAGHYEFGSQRQAISLSRQSAAQAPTVWADGDAIGYARQWAEVYGHLARLLETPLKDRIVVVRYEDLCADPAGVLAKVVAHCGLADPDGAIAAFAQRISESEAAIPEAVRLHAGEIEAITGPVARTFGYVAVSPGARTEIERVAS